MTDDCCRYDRPKLAPTRSISMTGPPTICNESSAKTTIERVAGAIQAEDRFLSLEHSAFSWVPNG